MTLSMHSALVPTATRTLRNLVSILEKIAAHAEARKIDPSIFLNARLYPDMFPLVRQVQIASDTVKGAVARLAGQEPPSWADTETTIEQLIERINRTIDFANSFQPAQIDGSEERPVELKMRSGTRQFTGQSYLLGHALPNLFFHTTTAYAIARHNGVEIGKADYLGRVE
ncbi:DUF1993 domain-containing protein [Uliginosibacterium sp. H1]|uniref:DUF1993 domain-containing protein n=1 Tax=Uliginosibacterium sp. H1 TaxID=3114757 RepID=UPI002E17203A|nr:DUF1993 domain-containing protein [Uliginosibacterium sp. H1]